MIISAIDLKYYKYLFKQTIFSVIIVQLNVSANEHFQQKFCSFVLIRFNVKKGEILDFSWLNFFFCPFAPKYVLLIIIYGKNSVKSVILVWGKCFGSFVLKYVHLY